MIIEKYGSRNWAVYDNSGCLICVTVSKKGANEVVRRLLSAGTNNLQEVHISHDKLTKLSKKLILVTRNFNQLMKEIKSIENKPLEAVLYNQNKKGEDHLCQQK